MQIRIEDRQVSKQYILDNTLGSISDPYTCMESIKNAILAMTSTLMCIALGRALPR